MGRSSWTTSRSPSRATASTSGGLRGRRVGAAAGRRCPTASPRRPGRSRRAATRAAGTVTLDAPSAADWKRAPPSGSRCGRAPRTTSSADAVGLGRHVQRLLGEVDPLDADEQVDAPAVRRGRDADHTGAQTGLGVREPAYVGREVDRAPPGRRHAVLRSARSGRRRRGSPARRPAPPRRRAVPGPASHSSDRDAARRSSPRGAWTSSTSRSQVVSSARSASATKRGRSTSYQWLEPAVRQHRPGDGSGRPGHAPGARPRAGAAGSAGHRRRGGRGRGPTARPDGRRRPRWPSAAGGPGSASTASRRSRRAAGAARSRG